MDVLYSPTTHTSTLIPRLSLSSSSSPSVCLCISRIQSIRSDFFGYSSKLRLKCRRKCKVIRFRTAQASVASFNSLPIVAVAFAIAMSAFAVVFYNFYNSKKKNGSIQVNFSFSFVSLFLLWNNVLFYECWCDYWGKALCLRFLIIIWKVSLEREKWV